MTTNQDAVRVRVPATTANLGPGFDALGLALKLDNFITITESQSGEDEIVASGEGASTLRAGAPAENIALIAAKELLRRLEVPPASLRVQLENSIPLARGLGSSSAARAGALVAANEWARRRYEKSTDASTLLALATELEGHPDNVAPALLGGLVVSAVVDNGQVLSLRVPVCQFPRLVVLIPEGELTTKAARGVLPTEVSIRDAAFNIARSSLLVAALVSEDWELLREATRDRLHQSQRAALMPAFDAVVQAAVAAGAYGATLSGAGPCILAWLPDDEAVVSQVSGAMQKAAGGKGVPGAAQEMQVDFEGCVVVGG